MVRKNTSVRFAIAASLGALGCGGSTSLDASPGSPTFVAVGARGTILSSPDGVTWTRQASGVSESLTSVAAGRSIFVAVGTAGTILSSPDGASWTARVSQTTLDLAHVIFNGEIFLAVGGEWSDQSVTLKSSDGVSWSRLDSPAAYSFHAVASVGNILVASAVSPSREIPMALDNTVLTSSMSAASQPTGWVQADSPRFTDSLTLADEILTVGSWNEDCTVSRSSDGLIWTTRDLPSSMGISYVSGIAFDGTTFVVVGGPSSVLSSTNATDWNEYPTPLARGWLSGVTYGSSGFVAVGPPGVIVTSPDGIAWTEQAAGIDADLSEVAYGPLAP